ncbi:FAD-dependent monooxygenase [Mangrovihabitans endophyticus]|uniref:3-(3-hydroxyphenyl)propionate hydroxylase n=1 Tax=Mangrovihabitans endophyticus TaxID=1751298 RepID=A0A8J3FPP7_9ACTN|nr:FAD-dependent monooxygenase [Mangrovihabitans endophyticus]GGL00949.1 3-(3-hydroxyphenyl)propionate hydroxylase [Mangrovihabitans endophyticus]
MRVLIVGAGPTGLTLAVDLRRRGVDVRVVDKATRFFAGSRADSIQPRTLEVFDDLGVLAEVRAAGSEQLPFRVHLDGKFVQERRMFAPRPPTPDVPYPNPWMLGQSQLEAILRRRLHDLGVRVELGTELTGLMLDAETVTARFATGEQARFAYAVGADGGASFVRKAIGVAFPGTTDETFRSLIGDVVAPDLDPSAGHWFAGRDNPMIGVAMTPVPGTGLFQFNTPLGDGDDASLQTMQATLDRFASGVRLTGCPWSTVWRPNARLAERYRVGRVFLAGDAAHVHPPTGGQGMNTGIQDAYNLGWKLAAETELDTYQSERRAEAARVLGVSSELLDRYRDGRADAHVRGEEHTGLTVTYRDAGAHGRIAPGDRAPDSPVTDANGNRIRLFDLFRGTHFTRLTFGAASPGTDHSYAVLPAGEAAVGKEHLVDAEGHAYAAYDATPGTSVLVRPDGYIAETTRNGREGADRSATANHSAERYKQ